MKKQVNPLLIMQINNTLSDPEELELFKENLLTYAKVLQMGKFSMDQYLNAVRYVGFKVMGLNNKEAYTRTFPEKVREFTARGVAPKDIASYTTAYNKSKLVTLIFEQTLIPTHILNAPMFQQAINVQAEIMMDTKQSGKVRSDAANSLMTHLKPPESKKVELDISVAHVDIIAQYESAMLKMAEKQMELVSAGGDLKQIVNTPLLIGEVIDI